MRHIVWITLMCLGILSSCSRHGVTPDGQVQRVSYTNKDVYYKDYYSPDSSR